MTTSALDSDAFPSSFFPSSLLPQAVRDAAISNDAATHRNFFIFAFPPYCMKLLHYIFILAFFLTFVNGIIAFLLDFGKNKNGYIM